MFQAAEVPFGHIGEVTSEQRLEIQSGKSDLMIDLWLAQLKEAWQKPLRW